MESVPFGERLRECMRLRGYEVKTFSQVLGISPRVLRALLYGKRLPKGRLVAKIAIALQIHADYLLGLSDELPK